MSQERMLRKSKILSFLLCFCLLFEQSGFAQLAGQLDISGHINAFRNSFIQDKFRPLHLRSLGYDNGQNNFRLLLDKGDLKNPRKPELEETTKTLLNYFFVGITLPNDAFWVNLRPDAEDNIIDPGLEATDVGRILLEADLQLKKDTAKFTSPETPEGKEYWDKLYQKAGELLGAENVTIPTLTRPWIVPGEIIIRETKDNAYIYKATLKVMLEQDYLKNSAVYNFKDARLKTLNEYASQLIREKILPKLTKEINTSKRYAPLRQVYYSLILAQWFKSRLYGKGGLYSWLIDKGNLQGLTSKILWSKTTYFQAYQKSFKDGEYNIRQPVYAPYGQTIRNYFSGGMALSNLMDPQGTILISGNEHVSSPLTDNVISVFTSNSHTLNPEVAIVEGASSPSGLPAGSSPPGSSSAIIKNKEDKETAGTPAPTSSPITRPEKNASSPAGGNSPESDDELTRRDFLKMFFGGGVAAALSLLVPDIFRKTAEARIAYDAPGHSAEDKSFLEKIRNKRQPVGDYLDSLLKLEGTDNDNFIWKQFTHYLNSSNWLGAARVLYAKKEFFNKIIKSAVLTKQEAEAIEALFSKLENLNKANLQWLSRKDFFRWFLYGTYFISEEKIKNRYADPSIKFFSQMQIYNNIFKTQAFSPHGSLIGVEQDHNWAFFYWKMAQKMGLLPASDPALSQQKKTKTVLVHFDAHEDIGGDFGIVVTPALDKNNEDLAKTAQDHLEIDNFITPAVGEGLVDEVVWVVPPEARETSGTYVPGYGVYEILVRREKNESGHNKFVLKSRLAQEGSFKNYIKETQDQIKKRMGKKEEEKLIEILSEDVRNTRMVRIHIVSPADIQTLKNISEEATNIILDIDEDFTGTSDPLMRKWSLPHFLTSEARHEELLRNLDDFYKNPDVQKKIGVVSIALSPGFTYNGESRDITA
ncbi:hypothetical protein EPN16_00900, partial [bacterium]